MKITSLIICISLISASCHCTKKTVAQPLVTSEKPVNDDKLIQNQKNDVMFEYTANTRGFYENIIIQNQTITVSKDRSNTEKLVSTKISDADWKQLISEFEKINLEKLSEYKDPTQKRFYDGAAIADLKITFKEKTYQTKSFDHGNPPLEIQKLVSKINSFVKKEE